MIYSIQEAFGQIKKTVLETVISRPKVDTFFKSLFPQKESAAFLPVWEEFRTKRNIIADISLLSEGKIIQLNKSTQNLIEPAFYKAGVSFTAIDAFQRMVSQSEYITSESILSVAEYAAAEMQTVLDALERTEELICAQALINGKFTLVNGGREITFNPKATHQVAYNAAHDFSIATVDPATMFTQLAQACITDGMADGSEIFIAILGDEVLNALQNNPIVQKRLDIKNFELGKLETMSQAGLVPQGIVSYGNFKFALFGYGAIYENLSGTTVKYFDPKKMLIMPRQTPKLQLFYGGTPAWSLDNPYDSGAVPVIRKGKRNFSMIKDIRGISVEMNVSSRPLPLVFEIDKFATATILN